MDFLIHHLLERSAERSPDKEALVDGDQRQSYRDVRRFTHGIAIGLRRAGLIRGDRIGICLEPCAAQVLSIFGISESGGVCVPINARLFPEQIGHIAKDCGIKGLITTPKRLSSLAGVLGQIPSLEFITLTGEGPVQEIGLATFRLEEFCELCGPLEWSDEAIGMDLATILYTSGSTGRPKGVMLSHANVLAGSRIVSAYLEIRAAERILAVLPFSFDAGMNQLMTAFQHGATIVLINFLYAHEVVQMLRREAITGLAGVPTFWSLMVQENSTLEENAPHSLRYITNTGGAMPQAVLKVLRRGLPTTKIFLMYGLTEAFRSTFLPPEELDRRPTSIGKAIPDTQIMVLDERGKLCKPGEPGELVHRGPTVSLGYWNRPEDTARTLRANPLLPAEIGDRERVCYSGDLVKMDEAGFFYFLGRQDTMIKSSGFRISPTEVEEVLFLTGKLRGAAVIGIPDELLGQVIKAFVVPKDGETIDTQALLTSCGEKMPRYMVPKVVEVLVELPKTPSGKIDYPALRRREGL
jgi:acyl-CoA ligase (AMP-forming) (exosortase A-associated)